MMTEPLPIQVFVKTRFQEKRVQQVIERWSVENHILEGIVIGYFEEMGIYSVSPLGEKKTMLQMMEFLKNSPEVLNLVEKVRQEQSKRNQSRHAAV